MRPENDLEPKFRSDKIEWAFDLHESRQICHRSLSTFSVDSELDTSRDQLCVQTI